MITFIVLAFGVGLIVRELFNRVSRVGTLEQFWYDQAAWSTATFGHGNGIGALKHLKKEVDECLANPSDLVEYADMMHLVFDACRRAGYTYDELADACHKKLAINRARKWGKKVAGEPCEHIEG